MADSSKNINEKHSFVLTGEAFSQINNFSTAFKPIMDSYLKNINYFSEYIGNIATQFQKIMKPTIELLVNNIPNYSSYFGELAETIKRIQEDPDSLINWVHYYEKLSDYLWTIPYEMTSEELSNILETVESEKDFDNVMCNYFNKEKVSKLLSELILILPKRHKVIFKQIKFNYYKKNYAISNLAILTIIDDLCSFFLEDKGRITRKNLLLPIIELEDNENNTYEAIMLYILNSNLNIIFETISFNEEIEITTNKKVRRNPCLHGKSISNKRIDVVMLLNTLYYLLIAINEYKIYESKIIYVKNNSELLHIGVSNTEVKRFYIKEAEKILETNK